MRAEPDPDVAWVGALTGAPARDCEAAVREAAGDRRLYAHLAAQHRRAGRESFVEIDAPLELHAIARLLRPAHVVEVGVSSGVSSAYLLRALERNGSGRLHSIDLPSYPTPKQLREGSTRGSWSLPPGRSSGWAVPPRLRVGWDLRLGDKADVIPILGEQLAQVDVMIYDVPHNESDIRKELRGLGQLLPHGSVVIVDHGPGGGECAALASWARSRGATPTGRSGLGLYGARAKTKS
jgi:hypothetical protein